MCTNVNRPNKTLKTVKRTKQLVNNCWGRVQKLNYLFSRNFPRMGGYPPSVKIINYSEPKKKKTRLGLQCQTPI